MHDATLAAFMASASSTKFRSQATGSVSPYSACFPQASPATRPAIPAIPLLSSKAFIGGR